jgi:pimeloyl-ACP methyl ester carboxylesterase
VSGLVVVPEGEVSTPRDVMAWAHGTTGLGDRCAISRQYAQGTGSEALLTGVVLPLGLAFVATDYQGLGTPGDHTFLVGQAEGRNVLDAVRAAAQLPGSGVSADSRTIIWGHSQGGGAAAFAAELAPTYAPELKVIGAMAGAPAGDLPAIATSLDRGKDFGYTLMALDGLRAAYPNLPFADVLTPKGLAELDVIKDQCSDDILSGLQGGASSDYIKTDLTTVPGFADVLKANTAGFTKTSVPIFLYHGDADDTVPVAVSKLMLDRYCALGVTVERKVYPGGTHVGVLLQAAGDLQRWITDRLAGTPVPSSC